MAWTGPSPLSFTPFCTRQIFVTVELCNCRQTATLPWNWQSNHTLLKSHWHSEIPVLSWILFCFEMRRPLIWKFLARIMTRYGIVQVDTKQGYTDHVNKANHSCGRFAESQPSSAGLQWTSSQQLLWRQGPQKGQGHSLVGTVHKGHQITHRAGDVRVGEGQAQGRALGEMLRRQSKREKPRWPLTCKSREGNCEGGSSQGFLREGTATSHLERGNFHLQPPSYRPEPPAMDRPVLPSIAQGPLVQAQGMTKLAREDWIQWASRSTHWKRSSSAQGWTA